MRGTILTLIAVLVVEGVAALVVAYTGVVNVAATWGHLPGVEWFLSTTQANSIDRHSRNISPPPLEDAGMREEGLVSYDRMCATCHGAPGVEPSEIGKGLNPSPPDLSKEQHPARANFWVIRNGIRMTGMPAFGETHRDEELWPIVAFLEELPQLSDDDYRRRVERAGLSHAVGGHGGSSGSGPREATGGGHEH